MPTIPIPEDAIETESAWCEIIDTAYSSARREFQKNQERKQENDS